MIIYIACAGSGTRWNNYKGVPKHLVPVHDEPLLRRTIQQCRKRFPDTMIRVSVGDVSAVDFYNQTVDISGIEYIVPKMDVMSRDGSALIGLSGLFEKDKQDTLVLLGDVYFSESAMDRISDIVVNTKKFRTIGRKGENPVTGCPHGELFAYFIRGNYMTEFIRIVYHVRNLHSNVLPRCTGWEITSALELWRQGAPRSMRDLLKIAGDILGIFNRREYSEDIFVEHIDETEDFDTPRDYVQWCVRQTLFKN